MHSSRSVPDRNNVSLCMPCTALHAAGHRKSLSSSVQAAAVASSGATSASGASASTPGDHYATVYNVFPISFWSNAFTIIFV